MENFKIVHRLLLTINIIIVFIYGGMIGIMLLFTTEFGFRGTANSSDWFFVVSTFIIGILGLIYSLKSKASYTCKSYIGLVILILLLIPYLYSTGLLSL